MNHGAEGQRSVIDTSRYDNIGSPVQGLRYGKGAEISIGGQDRSRDLLLRGSGFKMPQVDAHSGKRLEMRHQVVAVHHSDLHAGTTGVSCHVHKRLGAAQRIQAAGIGDQAHAVFAEQRQGFADQRNEIVGVADSRILLALLLENRHGNLGKVVHDHVIKRTAPQ